MSQANTILKTLKKRRSWVPMPQLAREARCFAVNSRIADLRKLGFRIANKVETLKGEKFSFYRLEGGR